MLTALTCREVDDWASDEDPLKFELLEIPCNSQAVERHVKLVSEAALKSSSSETRDGIVRCKKSSYDIMPACRSKKDFCV